MRIHAYFFILAMLFPFSAAWADLSSADNPAQESAKRTDSVVADIKFPITIRPISPWGAQSQKTTKNYEIGKSMSADVGEAVIYWKEATILPGGKVTIRAWSPEQDTVLTSGFFLNFRYPFRKVEKYPVRGEVMGESGKMYDVLLFVNQADNKREDAILIDRNAGEIYSKVASTIVIPSIKKDSFRVSSGTYSSEPATRMVRSDYPVERKEEEKILQNFAVVYAGRDGTSLNFELRRFEKGQVKKSERLSFDAMQQSIEISVPGQRTFKVDIAKSDKDRINFTVVKD